MGEPNGATDDFQHAGSLGAREAGLCPLRAGRGDQDGHARLRERGGIERDLLGGGIQGVEACADEAVEAAWHLERRGCRPVSTPLERAPELEGVERRPAGDRVEAREDRA